MRGQVSPASLGDPIGISTQPDPAAANAGFPVAAANTFPSTDSVTAGSDSSNTDHVAELGGHKHVSVQRGKSEFNELQRHISNLSRRSEDLARTQTRRSTYSIPSGLGGPAQQVTSAESSQDPSTAEKGEAKEEEFNLVDFLRTGKEKRDEAGIKAKKVGVIWEDLEVLGAGGMRINIRNFSDAVVEQFTMPVKRILSLFGCKLFSPKPKTIIHPNSGLLKPGEMCLVVGRPGSGCSTFLKTITNQRGSYLEVKGNVEYAGVDWREMAKRYAGEVCYNQEDDDHLPTLTVAQTLRFALETKTPGKKIPGVSNKQFREMVLNMLLSMLNIKHTANTNVGNAFMRGVSGGERKRVSIAEMFCGNVCVASWDNSTRGLDASTALDYAKSLRLLTDIMGMTTFVSLYQAGEGIYKQFDKVMVLDEGHVVYFGPIKEARPYMIGLGYEDQPRQTTADYLSGCTDENERRFQQGRTAENVPSTPETMEKAYLESPIHARMMAEKDEYKHLMQKDAASRDEFREAVSDQKHKGVTKKSPYTVPFYSQVIAIAKRQTILKLQDTFGLWTSYGTSFVVAFIIGSVFFQLPETASGAFTRGGLLFFGLLFNVGLLFQVTMTDADFRPLLPSVNSPVKWRDGRSSTVKLATAFTDRLLMQWQLSSLMCRSMRQT